MKVLLFSSRSLAVFCIAFLAMGSCALAQPARDFEPQVGQRGKDVIWLPTAQALVDRMLDMAKVTARDYVIDLGSGDGRTVIAAANRGAKALGIEYNPDMVELSRRRAAEEGVRDKATFVRADIFNSDFSQATVLTMFLLPELNLRLRPIILTMKPGTRVVSNSFDMGDWKPDQTVEAARTCTQYCRAFLWIVPAKVQGSWQVAQGVLELTQTFQMLSGSLYSGNIVAPISNGWVKGDELTFRAGNTEYVGRVIGNVIEGFSKTGGKEATWRATRDRI